MDSDRFDTMTRILHNARARRNALVTLLGLSGSVGFSLAETVAAKKKKSCPPCKKRKKGKCKKKLPDGAACAGGTCQSGTCVAPPAPPSCVGQPDNAPCGSDGRCRLGECQPHPTCLGIDGNCTSPGAQCCSDSCAPFPPQGSFCGCSPPSKPCYATSDCCQFPAAATCVGYICATA